MVSGAGESLFFHKMGVFIFGKFPKKILFNSQTMYDNFKNFNEFLLADERMIETKLFDRPEDG